MFYAPPRKKHESPIRNYEEDGYTNDDGEEEEKRKAAETDDSEEEEKKEEENDDYEVDDDDNDDEMIRMATMTMTISTTNAKKVITLYTGLIQSHPVQTCSHPNGVPSQPDAWCKPCEANFRTSDLARRPRNSIRQANGSSLGLFKPCSNPIHGTGPWLFCISKVWEEGGGWGGGEEEDEGEEEEEEEERAAEEAKGE